MSRTPSFRSILAAGLCSAAALALGYGWGRAGARTPAPAEAPEGQGVVATVRVAPMVKGTLEGRTAAFGSIVAAPGAAQTVSVAYECRVVTLTVSEGQAVAAGAPLATVTDSPDALLSLDQARIDARAADAQLQQVLDRHALKLADNAALAQARQAADSAKVRVKSLEARHMGGLHVLRASGPGVVVQVPVQAGAVVPAGGSLLELVATSRLEARLGTDPQLAAGLRPGGTLALAAMDGSGARGSQARIRAVSLAINPTTRLRDVCVSLPPGHPFLYGQCVQGTLLATPGEGLLVPYASVLPEGGRNLLYTVRKGHAFRHEVQILAQSGERLELSALGLDPAEPVVIQGNYELKDGMAVQLEGLAR